MKMTEIKTDHLRLSPSLREELPALDTLYGMAHEYFTFDPPPVSGGTLTALSRLNGEHLPPGGKAEDQTHFSIWSGNNLIGYFCVDLNCPDEQSAYLSILFIAPGSRRNGMGREIMTALKARLKDMGYKRLRLGVSLHNWAGLSFWLRQGFDKITKIVSDADLARPGLQALIELECDLLKGENYDI